MKTYFYISGNMGYTRSGSFSRDKSRWLIFTDEEKERITKPYGATKNGVYVPVDKYQ